MNMKIEVGQQAPDFTLHASDKSEISLSAQKGKNVLLFIICEVLNNFITINCAMKNRISH